MFKSDRLAPEWTFSAGAIIWRMVLAEPALLVGECRDPQTKSASFFGIELGTGKVLWNELRLHDPWWVGIEGVQKNVVLFHGYAKPDMPEHKGIRAIDSSSGKQLWQNDEVSYWFGLEDRVVAYRDLFERRTGYELDLQSGALLKTHDGSLEELHGLRLRAAEEQPPPDVILPEVYSEAEAGMDVAVLVERDTKGKKLSGAIEYIRNDTILVFNYHVRNSDAAAQIPMLENHLAVYQLSEKKRLYADRIGSNLKAYVPDSFFMKDSLVLFVKDQQILTALRPWKS